MRKRLVQQTAHTVHAFLRALWAKRFVRYAVGALGVMVCLVVGLQFTYPADRALPNAHIGGESVGWKTHDELAPLLATNFATTEVSLKAANQTTSIKLADSGASLRTEAAIAELTDYPWWQRLLPFSLFFVNSQITHLPLEFNEAKLASASGELATKLKADPKNGAVTVNEAGEVSVSAAEDGVSVRADSVQKTLQNSDIRFGTTTLVLEPELVTPKITNDMISATKSKLADVLKTEISIVNSTATDTVYTPDAATIASWIRIGDQLALSIDKESLLAYSNSVAKESIVKAGTTTVVVVDGIEQSRTAGQSGRGIDGDALHQSVSDALLSGGDARVTMKFKTLAPTITYQRSYSSSQAALQSYVTEVSAGKNIEISVRQLTGSGWSASSNAGKSVVAASTYKLFISQLLFDRINAGQINWSDAIQGTTVETCLRNTIVLSANNCAEQWISQWGRTTINSSLYAKGYSNATTFTASDATHTSAADLQKLLAGLHSKTMFNDADSTRLIGHMKQQVYRQGIPAGSAGTVADKVGFLWDYLNDAAVVYHPRGTYILVVMTQGQSWGKIAEITRQIEKIMYP